MKILVTGATGLIGSHLIKELLKGDVVLYTAGRSVAKLKDSFKEYLENPNLHFCEYGETIANIEALGHLDYIFHLAGPIDPEIIRNRPMDVVRPNVIDLNKILEYAAKEKKNNHHCRVVVTSSCAIYQNNLDTDITVAEEDSARTDYAGDTFACYTESKRYAELMSLSYAKQYGVDVVVGRISYVYGYTKHMPQTAIYSFMGRALKGEKIEVQTVNLPRRDWIYVDDVVTGLIIIATKAKSGEVFNISSNGDKENYAALDEFARSICKVVYKNATEEHLFAPKSEQRKPGLRFNNAKLKECGWKVNFSLEEGIKETIMYYQNCKSYR